LESKKEQRAKRFQIASAAATVSDETLLKRKQRFGDSVGTDDEVGELDFTSTDRCYLF
jgi:hypothetical protein